MCDAVIRADLGTLEAETRIQIPAMLDEAPEEALEERHEDTCVSQLDEFDHRIDRLIDAFSRSPDMNQAYLERALMRLEKERQQLLETRKRDSQRLILLKKLIFDELSIEDKKRVAAQFIRRIEVGDYTARVVWNV